MHSPPRIPQADDKATKKGGFFKGLMQEHSGTGYQCWELGVPPNQQPRSGWWFQLWNMVHRWFPDSTFNMAMFHSCVKFPEPTFYCITSPIKTRTWSQRTSDVEVARTDNERSRKKIEWEVGCLLPASKASQKVHERGVSLRLVFHWQIESGSMIFNCKDTLARACNALGVHQICCFELWVDGFEGCCIRLVPFSNH